MKQRILTACWLIPLAILWMFFVPETAFAAGAVVLVLLGAYEWGKFVFSGKNIALYAVIIAAFLGLSFWFCNPFSENLPLFKLAMAVRIEGRDFLFTHAGVGLGWLRYRMPKVNVNDVHDICKSLNDKLKTEESLYDFVFNGLMDVSASRWGYARYPSPVWTDETDHQYMRERLPNVYQVFGHTQQESEPVITEQYACLDCRRAFLITNKGNIIEA